jgi:tetratricopeptide (TPR) repeat protein
MIPTRIALVLLAAPALFLAHGCAKKATQSVQTAAALDEGERLFKDGNYDRASAYFQGLLEKDSTNVDAVVYLTRIALNQDDYDGAIRWIERGLALAPDSSNVHYWAATAYVVKLQRENAFPLVDKVKSHIETAVELDSTNLDARMFLAGFLLNAPPIAGGSIEKAKEQAGIIARQDPYRGHLFWAEVYKKEKKFDDAARAYEAASQADPDSPDPYYLLGMMYQGNKAYDEAFAAFEKALVVDPEATGALYQVGRTGVLSGQNLERAIAALKQYLQTEPPQGQPTRANAHWRLGQLYELEGNLEMARQEFGAALALDPNDEKARESLDNLGKPKTDG